MGIYWTSLGIFSVSFWHQKPYKNLSLAKVVDFFCYKLPKKATNYRKKPQNTILIKGILGNFGAKFYEK